MIEEVIVIDGNYSGLEEIFPTDHELRTDSDLVILVGPNGSGKTAFLRMLATSLDNERNGDKLSQYTGSRDVDSMIKLLNSIP